MIDARKVFFTICFHGLNSRSKSSFFSIKKFSEVLTRSCGCECIFIFVDSYPSKATVGFFDKYFRGANLILKNSSSYWSQSIYSALCYFSPSDEDLILHINSDLILDLSESSPFLTAFYDYYRHPVFRRWPASFAYCDMYKSTVIKGGSSSSVFISNKFKNSLNCSHLSIPADSSLVVTFNANFLIIPGHLHRVALTAFAGFRHAYADTLFAFYSLFTGVPCIAYDIYAGWQYHSSKSPSYSVYHTGLLFRDIVSLSNSPFYFRFCTFLKYSFSMLMSPTGFDFIYFIIFGFRSRGLIGVLLVNIIIFRSLFNSIAFVFIPSLTAKRV